MKLHHKAWVITGEVYLASAFYDRARRKPRTVHLLQDEMPTQEEAKEALLFNYGATEQTYDAELRGIALMEFDNTVVAHD